jgi:cytochrome c peroxidase
MGYRDGKLHDVGTSNKTDVGLNGGKPEFDTPSLKGVKNGGPFYHDGSVKTLEELVASVTKDGRHMGDTSHLSDAQRKALVAYLKTL